ncbi:MAG: L,D-transpeptidase, partial [Armatimonadota bacterium]
LILVVGACAAYGQQPPVEPLPEPIFVHPAYSLIAPLQQQQNSERRERAFPGFIQLEDLQTGGPVEPLPDRSDADLGFEPLLYSGEMDEIVRRFQDERVVYLPQDILQPLEPRIRLVWPEADSEIVEGSSVTFQWLSAGPIKQVRLYYYYSKCRLAGRSRGNQGKLITDKTLNKHQYTWDSVPWVDGKSLRARIAGFDEDGTMIAEDEIGLRYRPKEFTNLPANCIAVLKRKQRLYCFADGVIRRMHLVSTARYPYHTPPMHPGAYDRRRGAMGKVFYKDPCAWSRMYECQMPYWMAITSTGSHGIHATSPQYYSRLGSPASHGCVRQHRADARKLYQMTPVGTPVYVF